MTDFIGNHLWQSTLFAAVAALFTLFFRKNHARVRYGLWLAASIKFLIPFSLFIAIGNSIDLDWRHSAPVPQTTLSYVEDISQPFGSVNDSPAIPAAAARIRFQWIPVLLYAIWLCGFLAILLHYLLKGRRLTLSLRKAEALRNGRALDVWRIIDISDRIRKRIRLVSSPFSMEPGVFGVFRPILLLPQGIVDRLTDSELEAIIAHEIAHVRRHDNLFAVIHMLVESLFWFHPMVWWIGAKLVQERENACDEEVLKLGKNPQSYAEGILKVCEFYLESPLICVSGVTGADMKKRIQTIMAHPTGRGLSLARKLILATAGCTALAIPFVIGILNTPAGQAQSQDGPKPAFEVASIKPTDKCDNEFSPRPGMKIVMIGGGSSFKPGGSYSTCAPLKSIIMEAYGIEFRSQISGGPDWGDNTLYKIDAKAENNADKEQMRLMLQSLLEDRFKLMIRRETQETQVYWLVVAKGGHKLKQAKDEQGNPILTLPPPEKQPSPEEQKSAFEALIKGGAPGSLPRPRPGSFSFRVFGNTGQTEISARAVSMERLASQLTNTLGDRRVIDKTGITGFYDIEMRYAFDSQLGRGMILAGPPGDGGIAPSAEPSGPTIFTALQEQLGLKLEAGKTPLDSFIIDSVEKPTEN
jgi:uncharacterized protein (TIGR03435 family)